mmetsp:Transcript_9701/g.15018  ORF Transcript_9701/g.15018 Transcript_9701/m.15018 type:complete len:456 (+) Transcript_9701:41-1408(+)
MPPSKAAQRAATLIATKADKEREDRTGVPTEKLEEFQAKSAIHARKTVEALLSKSKWATSMKHVSQSFPVFCRREFVQGRVMGKGGFCTVMELHGVILEDDGDSVIKRVLPTSGDMEEDERNVRAAAARRKVFVDTHKRNGESKYVIKKISDDVAKDMALYVQGIMDMGVETYYLSVLNHPNIIKLRGVANCEPYERKYFICLDRLTEIMDKRLITWGKDVKKCKRIFGDSGRLHQLFQERLEACYGVGSALQHLHEHRIVYRDLKPENVGFDVNGVVKLFDFGLAKELHPENERSDGTYKLSGVTGSLRYMSPEVSKGLPYNFKADTYSFSIFLWELISLDRPFAGFSVQLHNEWVIHGGNRPKINQEWPMELKSLMQRGWSVNISKRPSMEEATNLVKSLLHDHMHAKPGKHAVKKQIKAHTMPKNRANSSRSLLGDSGPKIPNFRSFRNKKK